MNKQKLVIRVDGNSEIGLGHIYRGIAIAEMLKEDFEVTFLIKANSNTSPIINAGFSFSLIANDIKLIDEPSYFVSILSSKTIIVLDGYNFDENYQQEIKANNFKLVYIDDLHQGVQKADIVINHNPGANKNEYKTEKYTKLALGLDYAILRKSFLNYKAINKNTAQKTENILVSFGGADIYDFTYLFVRELIELDGVKCINIVLGAAYTHTKLFSLTSNKIKIYQQVKEEEMLMIMKKSDIAIVPSSTILFELFAVDVPVLSGYYAKNQKEFYEFLVAENLITGLGNFSKFEIPTIKNKILNFKKSERKKLIDGKQKQRIRKLFKKL